MKSLFGVTNELKQELFLLRNSRAESKHRDKPNATPAATSPPLQPETPSMPSEATTKSTADSRRPASATKSKGSSGPPSSNEPKVERKNKESNRKSENYSNENTANNITWFGTSISKALDQKKFEADTKSKIKFVKSFGIKAEENQFYPELNLTDTVHAVLSKTNPDAIILQAGSIEISNFDVKKALMDTDKDLDEYWKQWTAKIEEDSANMFKVAVEATKRHPAMKVLVVKRLPRYDPISSDPKGIKSELSKFGNHVYDQLWFKGGCPKNIFIVDFELNCSDSGYLKDLIFGKSNEQRYDGVHARGEGGQRHFTYRAIDAVKVILRGDDCPKTSSINQSRKASRPGQSSNTKEQGFRYPSKFVRAKKVKQNQSKTFQYGKNHYSIPVNNRFLENC